MADWVLQQKFSLQPKVLRITVVIMLHFIAQDPDTVTVSWGLELLLFCYKPSILTTQVVLCPMIPVAHFYRGM